MSKYFFTKSRRFSKKAWTLSSKSLEKIMNFLEKLRKPTLVAVSFIGFTASIIGILQYTKTVYTKKSITKFEQKLADLERKKSWTAFDKVLEEAKKQSVYKIWFCTTLLGGNGRNTHITRNFQTQICITNKFLLQASITEHLSKKESYTTPRSIPNQTKNLTTN